MVSARSIWSQAAPKFSPHRRRRCSDRAGGARSALIPATGAARSTRETMPCGGPDPDTGRRRGRLPRVRCGRSAGASGRDGRRGRPGTRVGRTQARTCGGARGHGTAGRTRGCFGEFGGVAEDRQDSHAARLRSGRCPGRRRTAPRGARARRRAGRQIHAGAVPAARPGGCGRGPRPGASVFIDPRPVSRAGQRPPVRRTRPRAGLETSKLPEAIWPAHRQSR